MPNSDDRLDDLIRSIADGTGDLDRLEPRGEVDSPGLKALRDVARIADFNRTLQDIPSDPSPPANVAEGAQLRRWGDLTLLEVIGAGSRGEVWRAWDPGLQREVALKFLQTTAADAAGAQGEPTLLHEARALARVRHPGVVTVHGIAEHEGRAGMWMEYLRGPTLAAEIERQGRLPASDVVRIGLALCSALEAVHQSDLVHRDLKPENINLEPDDRTVLTDFGLGLRPTMAEAGTISSSGTPMFMAPEVLDGSPPSSRSDLYALGVTMWWALAGSPPFGARTLQELKEEARRGPPKSLRTLRPDAPRGLVQAIERAMDPAPETRAPSAAKLAVLLRSARGDIDKSVRGRGWTKAASVVAALTLGVLAVLLFLGRDGSINRVIPGRSGGSPSIAVLPMVNLSGDPAEEYFADGMTDELIARLAQVSDLRVSARSSVMPFKGSKEPLETVAKKLGVKMVVEGSVARRGDRVRVSAQLVDVRSGRAIWAEIYDRDLHDVFALQRDVAKAVVGLVEARITPDERGRMERVRDVNPRAHTAYLQGLAAYQRHTPEGIQRGINLFERAISLDSSYAEPWVALAYAHDEAIMEGLTPRAEGNRMVTAAANRAIELDPESGRARAILATQQFESDRDFASAERRYREAIELAPGDANVRVELAVLLVGMGRFDEALREANRAREVDPLSSLAATISLFPLFEGRRYNEAVTAAKEVLATHPSPHVMLILAQSLLFSGKHDEAIDVFRKAMQEVPSSTTRVGWLGLAYGRAGRPAEARAILDRLAEVDRTQKVDPYYFAIVHLGLGENARALDYLEEGAKTGSSAVTFYRVDPVLDPVRHERRFKALLKRLRMD